MRIDVPELPGLDLDQSTEGVPSRHGEVRRVRLRARASDGVARSISDLPTAVVHLEPGGWRAHWFSADWGCEFTPEAITVQEPVRLGVSTGRSSKGMHPWVCLVREGGEAIIVSVAWSGNWRIDVLPEPDGSLRVLAGVSPWRFERMVGEEDFVAPDVWVCRARSRGEAGAALAEAFSRTAAPRTDTVAGTWNHWWPYEDAEINHDVFVANARVAADLGASLATLDAGWFGPSDVSTFWEDMRGDWDEENTARFPGGTAALASDVRDLGLEFGVWCELEAIGPRARVAREHPDVVARDDDDASLGYVCLGSPAGWSHARESIDRLLTRTGARWLKLDFNLDPGAGCRRTDHGHAAGDGLYEHYLGLYRLLDEVRAGYPDLTIEACSSGGLRLDLGLAEHVHCLFLSDPDWTEFHLQLMWGASQMFPAASLFHFSESQWRGDHPRQHLDPATLADEDLDASIRAVLLHRFALSLRLVDLSDAQRDRVRDHLRTHLDAVAPLLRRHATISPLTDQPLRDGDGERWPVFQLAADDTAGLVVAVALDGHGPEQIVRPLGLDPRARYSVDLIGIGADQADLPELAAEGAMLSGDRLARGLRLRRSGPARSWLISLTRLTDD